MSTGDEALLEVRDLKVHFPVRKGVFGRATGAVKAVDGVSLRVLRGRTLGLVGESGCGKTTLARAILQLIPATSGQVRFDGRDFLALSGRELRAARRDIQIIFQDPAGSLNPRHTIETIVGEALIIHRMARGKELRDRVARLLERVGLDRQSLDRYPHEFSGGQRQRIGIARALALEPKLIICDEPVSGLDVSIQAQIINLLADLQAELGLSYLFVAHNLAVVKHFSDDVAVIGTSNLDRQSLRHSYEVNLVVLGRGLPVSLSNMLEHDIGEARPLTEADAGSRFSFRRLRSRLAAFVMSRL